MISIAVNPCEPSAYFSRKRAGAHGFSARYQTVSSKCIREREELMSYENEVSKYDENFGNCPKCGRTHGCRSIGREHWYVCHTHKTKWGIGWNIFTVEQTTEE